MNLNLLSRKLSDSRFLTAAIFTTSLIGLADALFLSADYYFGAGVKCLITTGCEAVLSSPYATAMGLPVSAFGIFFYAGIFVMISLIDTSYGQVAKKLLVIAASVGLGVSLALLYIQMFILDAYCFYCLVSFITSVLLFIFSVRVYKDKRTGSPTVGGVSK